MQVLENCPHRGLDKGDSLMKDITKNTNLINLVCWRRRMEGFVSKECGLLRFFPVAMAAAAATPIGPENTNS